MFTFVYFVSIDKMTIIEWAFQDIFDLTFAVWLAIADFYFLIVRVFWWVAYRKW